MLKDPRAEGAAENFAGQWLNLPGGKAPVRCRWLSRLRRPLRQRCGANRCSSNDRPCRSQRVDLLNRITRRHERLAKHYAYERLRSQFRRVTLGPTWKREGPHGKGVPHHTSKPERTSPVTPEVDSWELLAMSRQIRLQMSRASAGRLMPPATRRADGASGCGPRVRQDCIQCHALRITRSAREIRRVRVAQPRSGTAIRRGSAGIDGTRSGPPGCVNGSRLLDSSSRSSARSSDLRAGRGANQDMPLVRDIAAMRQGRHRFSRSCQRRQSKISMT